MPTMIVMTDDLEPGQIVAEDILNPSGLPLVNRNTVLNAQIIRLIKDKEYIERVKIHPADKEIAQLHEIGGIGLNSPICEQAKEKVGHFLRLASSLDCLESGHVEQLTSDIRPVVKNILDGASPIFDSLRSLSAHDDYTHQHSWMVMILSLSILRGSWDRGILRPDGRAHMDLGLGAILHDIGKTHIPLDVLNKPGRLTRSEWETIRNHPSIGYSMVKDTENLLPLAKAIIAHHHQCPDGSGYGLNDRPPLAGDEIPDLVRITTVADVYDALVSERPYRMGYLPYHALRFLESNLRTKFDERFVHILKKIVVDFPKGSMLLFPEGIIGCVTETHLDEKENPEILVIGVLCQSSAHHLGKRFRWGEPGSGMPGLKNLLLGATSLANLALKLKHTEAPDEENALTPFAEERTLVSLSEWEERFEEHFKFLLSPLSKTGSESPGKS